MSKEQLPFVVPEELQDRVDDHVLRVHDQLQDYTLEGVHTGMEMEKAKLREVPATEKEGKRSITGAVVLGAKKGDPEAGVNVLALPHLQTWKPHMLLRAHAHHMINNPDGVTVVLPNNGLSKETRALNNTDRKKVASGDMRPFYEGKTRAVEEALEDYSRLGAVSLDGYSLGGLTVAGMAATGSDRLHVTKVHSYEAPNKQTTALKLGWDFMTSGTNLGKAIEDAQVPALKEATSPLRMAVDFAKFGVAAVGSRENRALLKGMANPQYAELVEKALANYDDMEFVAGHIADSKLFDPTVVEYIRDPRFRVEFIDEGPGSHKHTTGDNIIAHALMMKS